MELSFHICYLLKHYHPCSIVNIPLSAIIFNNTQRETRFICRLVICKVESFMLHPICGFVASLVNCFADSWYGELLHHFATKTAPKLWVSFGRISADQKRHLLGPFCCQKQCLLLLIADDPKPYSEKRLNFPSWGSCK